MLKKAAAILVRLRAGSEARSEMSYTALARLHAAAGDPDAAFAVLQEYLASGLPPRLRAILPVLLALCERGDTARAMEVCLIIVPKHPPEAWTLSLQD